MSSPRFRRRGRKAEWGEMAAAASRRVGLTTRGWVLLAVGALCVGGGWLARYPGLLGIGLASLVAVAVATIGLLARRAIAVRREIPTKPVRRLAEATATVRLTESGRADGGEVEFTECIAGVQQPAERMPLHAKQAGITYPLPTMFPGEVTIGPATVRIFGFAGLARMHLVDRGVDSLLVLARALPVRLPDSGRLPVDAPRADEVEGGGMELRSLRPYQPGDDLRKVNARISARIGKLMIRQDAEPAISTVCVVLDLPPGTDPGSRAEMLDVATSIAGSAVRSGLPLTWTARGRDGLASADADGLGQTERVIAGLPLSDADLPRLAGADLTIGICGPATDPGEFVHQISARAEHRRLVVLAIDAGGHDGHGRAGDRPDRQVSGPRTVGSAVVVPAGTAEQALRFLANSGAGMVGAGR